MEFSLTPAAATAAVLWGGLAIGLVLGAAGQASRFCVRGAIADRYASGSNGRLGAWVVAVVVAALGSQALVAAGVFDAPRTLPWAPRLAWLSCLVGGLLFGYGMILAAGCPQRSLVKAGQGNLRAWVTLVVSGVAAQMTLRGLFARPRAEGLDAAAVPLQQPQDLGSLLATVLPLPAAGLRWAVLAAAVALALLWLWKVRGAVSRTQVLGGVVVGLLVPAAWFVTGRLGFLAEHPETLDAAWLGTQSGRPEGLSFTAPLAHTLDLLTLWTDKNTVASFGVLAATGAFLGSFVSARLRGEFKLETFKSPAELRDHLVGALLMGFGGVTALGCSLGNGVTGLAMLSAGAVLATAGIVAGALLALKVQARRAAPAAAPSAAAVARQ